MIVIPRGLARAFRAVARKCVSGRPRGPAPPVVVRAAGRRLTLAARFDGVVLSADAPADGSPDGVAVVPMAVLDAVDADAPVELEVSGLKGTARWDGPDGPRTVPFDAVLPGKPHDPPAPPARWSPVPPAFLAALHACGRQAGREPGRFALTRVQVQGKPGRVAATDGRQALLWGGFDLPFADDKLVPAVPAFGTKELAGQADVRVGATPDGLAVRAGPWTVWLTADRTGRFPDVSAVVPKTGGTVAGLDDRDADDLLAALPGLPGNGDDDRAVTLDVGRGVAVLGRDDATGESREVRLARSTFAGPPARVAVDRRALARALSLGCRTLRVVPGRPLTAEGPDRTFVAVALDPSRVAPPAEAATAEPDDLPSTTRRTTAMRPHEPNGASPNGRHDPPAGDPPDPLAEAEALRAALADAALRAGRLVQALKQYKRERRALASAWTSLKSLGLGPGGGP